MEIHGTIPCLCGFDVVPREAIAYVESVRVADGVVHHGTERDFAESGHTTQHLGQRNGSATSPVGVALGCHGHLAVVEPRHNLCPSRTRRAGNDTSQQQSNTSHEPRSITGFERQCNEMARTVGDSHPNSRPLP